MAGAAAVWWDRPMRPSRTLGSLPRPLALPALALVLSLAVTGCGDDGAKKAEPTSSREPSTSTSVTTDLPTDLPTGLPTDLPTDLPTSLPTDLPTDLSTDLPTEVATTGGADGTVDGCAVVSAEVLAADLGIASAGQSLSQPSSYGDPNAKDCYYVGGAATIVVQATTRADADMPASSNNYEGLPGAEQVPGADRGWVFAQTAQGSTTASLILVKGQHGINASIIVSGSTVTLAQLQKLAQDVLPTL
jgi:PT repeat